MIDARHGDPRGQLVDHGCFEGTVEDTRYIGCEHGAWTYGGPCNHTCEVSFGVDHSKHLYHHRKATVK